MFQVLRRTIAILAAFTATENVTSCPVEKAVYRDTYSASGGTARFRHVKDPVDGASTALALHVHLPAGMNEPAYDGWLLVRTGDAGTTTLIENVQPGKPLWTAVETRDGRLAPTYALRYFSWNDDLIPTDQSPTQASLAPRYLLIPAISDSIWSSSKRTIGSIFKLAICLEKPQRRRTNRGDEEHS
jgi:hypothetical protein